MALCRGTPDSHCCWLHGVECKYLNKDPDPSLGRDISCSLLVELGSWGVVYTDPRYVENVQPFWDSFNPDIGCGDWPIDGQTCRSCEVG